MDLLTLVAQRPKQSKCFLFSICTSSFSSVVLGVCIIYFFIMKCCCLLKRKSAQNIFVNQWCAINGLILSLEWWTYKRIYNEKECIILLNQMWLKVNEDLWNEELCSCLFQKLHVNVVLWSESEHVWSLDLFFVQQKLGCPSACPFLSRTPPPSYVQSFQISF